MNQFKIIGNDYINHISKERIFSNITYIKIKKLICKEGFYMNLWTGYHVILPKNINSVEGLSEYKKKSLDQINQSLELYDFCHFFEKVEATPKEGDIFVVQVVQGKYVYGKVISTNTELFDDYNKLQSEFVVVLYRDVSDSPSLPDYSLDLDNLLLKPFLQTRYFFNSGYAKIITNVPLTKEEKEMNIGFEIGCKFLDMQGNVLKEEPKYKGVLRIAGLGIAYDVARILTIDDTVIGEEFKVPVRKNLPTIRIIKEQEINDDIESMIKNIKHVQKELGSYNKAVRKAIPVLSKAFYSFLNKVANQKNEEKYLELVEELVESINQINDYTDHCLIETDEREVICTFIDTASKKHGYNFGYDITEHKRKW